MGFLFSFSSNYISKNVGLARIVPLVGIIFNMCRPTCGENNCGFLHSAEQTLKIAAPVVCNGPPLSM